MSEQSEDEAMEDASIGDEQEGSVGDDEDDKYYPKRILTEVKEAGEMKYLIEWEDWPLGAATTEPKCNFEDNPGLRAQWEREKRRIRLGKSEPYPVSEWKEAKEEWDRLPESTQKIICEKMERDREAAEAIGNYGDASDSAGSSDEAGEGPIEISDDSTGASKKRPSKFKNSLMPEISEDEDSDHDLVAAPNGARLPLGKPTKPKKAPRDNIGVTGYQGNANRAPPPPRTAPGETTQKKPPRRIDGNNKARRDGERKKAPQKMQEKIVAVASGQRVNNGSEARFRNTSRANKAHRPSPPLADRQPAFIPGLRSLADGGKRVKFGQPSAPASSSTAPAAPTQVPSAGAQAHTAGRGRESGSPSDDDDIPERLSTNFSTAAWPRMKQPEKPTEKELLKKREEALRKQIEDSKSALANVTPISDNASIEAVVFNARMTSSAGSLTSGTLLPAATSHVIIAPSNPIRAIVGGTSSLNTGQARAQAHPHRPKTDPLFVQPTKERIANQDRIPRLISQSSRNATVNNVPQALPPPIARSRLPARPSVSFQDYQASRRGSGAINAPLAPPNGYRAVNEPSTAVGKIVSEEMVGCQYEALLPHLANPKREMDTAYYYLLFPSVATPLADNITKWLRKSSKWAKVFHCQQSGSWARFVELTCPGGDKINGGCLIVHSSLRRMISKQPRMMTFLLNGNNTVWCADETAPDGRILNQVFKEGGTLLVTPKMFETQPQQVVHILDWFIRKKLPSTRGKIWKLALLRHMTSYLHDLWQRKAKEREELIRQYRQAGEPDQKVLKIAESITLSKKDIESMALNLHLVQKIKQYGVVTNALAGTKEAETVFVELSGGVGYEDDVAIVEAFAMYSLLHWQPTRKWIVIGTGEPANKATEKKDLQVITNGAARSAEQQSNGDNNDKGGQSLQSLAGSVAKEKGRAIGVATADNIDRDVFMVNTGVSQVMADHYLAQAFGDIGLALRLRELDLREGIIPAVARTTNTAQMPPSPDKDGDTAMEDASQESGEVSESNAPASRPAQPPTPPQTATETMQEDAVSMVPDTAPPPPRENAPPPPPAKVKFNLPSPALNKKAPPAPHDPASSESAPASASASMPTTNEQMDIDMTEQGEGQDKPMFETRPTLEWYKEREMENTDWKHIWVRSYGQAAKFFGIEPMAVSVQRQGQQPQQQPQPQQK